MGFSDAVKTYIRRYFEFRGRSSRSEFWWIFLLNILVYFGVIIVMGGLSEVIPGFSGGIMETAVFVIWIVFIVGSIIPVFNLTARRLHDQDKSAWWMLLYLVPFGSIVLIVFYCFEGTRGPNRFGYDPLGGGSGVFD